VLLFLEQLQQLPPLSLARESRVAAPREEGRARNAACIQQHSHGTQDLVEKLIGFRVKPESEDGSRTGYRRVDATLKQAMEPCVVSYARRQFQKIALDSDEGVFVDQYSSINVTPFPAYSEELRL
jgi:hypothetical protein